MHDAFGDYIAGGGNKVAELDYRYPTHSARVHVHGSPRCDQFFRQPSRQLLIDATSGQRLRR
jgi:hypothetical protein